MEKQVLKKPQAAMPTLRRVAMIGFPPAATLLFVLLTEWIARGTLDLSVFTQYIFAHFPAYLLAWALLLTEEAASRAGLARAAEDLLVDLLLFVSAMALLRGDERGSGDDLVGLLVAP